MDNKFGIDLGVRLNPTEMAKLKGSIHEINKIGSKKLRLTSEIDKLGLASKVASNNMVTLSDKILIAAKSFGVWMGVTTLFFGAIRSIRNGIDAVREFDSAMLEVNKVLDLTTSQAEAFTKTANEIGKTIGRVGSEVVKATAAFGRMGFSLEEATKLGKDALILYNVGDGIDSVEQSTSALIATLKGFNMDADQSRRIIDSINEVSNNFAVDAGDLAEGIKRVSSVMAQGNTSMEQTLGLVTGATEVMQNAEKASTAIRTITQRIRGLEEGFDTQEEFIEISGKMEDAFKTYADVDIMDNGQLRPVYEILKDTAAAWSSMSENEREYLAQQASGIRQVTAFNALMSNFESVLGATETALNSQGSALIENEKYLQSIEGRVQTFNAELQSLWVNAINSETIKSLVDFATGILKIVDAFGLLNTVLVVTSGIITAKLVPALLTSALPAVTTVGKGIAGMILPATASTTALSGLATAFKGLAASGTAAGAALSAFVPFLVGAGLVAGAIALKKYFDNAQTSAEKTRDTIDDLVLSYQNQQMELQNLTDKYTYYANKEEQSLSDKMELIELEKELKEKYGDTAKEVDFLNKSLEENVQIIQAMERADAREQISNLQKEMTNLRRELIPVYEVMEDLNRVQGHLTPEVYDFSKGVFEAAEQATSLEDRVMILTNGLSELEKMTGSNILPAKTLFETMLSNAILVHDGVADINRQMAILQDFLRTNNAMFGGVGYWGVASTTTGKAKSADQLWREITGKPKPREGGVGGGGASSAGSKATPYTATINALEKYETVLEDINFQLDKNGVLLENAYGKAQIPLYEQRVFLLEKEKKLNQDLLVARQGQISSLLEQAKKFGVTYKYQKDTNQLTLNYQDILKNLSGDTAKELEEIIKNILDLNKANYATSIDILSATKNIKDQYAEIYSIYEEEVLKKMEKQKDSIDDLIAKEEAYYDKRISGIEYQIEKEREATELVDKQAEIQERLLAIETARNNLQRAMRERNVQILRDEQGTWEWIADPKVVEAAQQELADAQKSYADLQEQNRREEVLKELDDEKKKWEDKKKVAVDSLKAQQDAIDRHMDDVKNIEATAYDERLTQLQRFVNSYNSMVGSMSAISPIAAGATTAKTVGSSYTTSNKGSIGTGKSATITYADGTKSAGTIINGTTYDLGTGQPVRNAGKGGTVTEHGSSKVYKFSNGGMKMGDGLAYLHNQERVLSERQTTSFERLVDLLPTFMTRLGAFGPTSNGFAAAGASETNYNFNGVTIQANSPNEFIQKLQGLVATTKK